MMGTKAKNTKTSSVEPVEWQPSLEDRVAELLIRYEEGDFGARERAILADIFASNPSNAWQRLEMACDHLGITGTGIGAHARPINADTLDEDDQSAEHLMS